MKHDCTHMGYPHCENKQAYLMQIQIRCGQNCIFASLHFLYCPIAGLLRRGHVNFLHKCGHWSLLERLVEYSTVSTIMHYNATSIISGVFQSRSDNLDRDLVRVILWPILSCNKLTKVGELLNNPSPL